MDWKLSQLFTAVFSFLRRTLSLYETALYRRDLFVPLLRRSIVRIIKLGLDEVYRHVDTNIVQRYKGEGRCNFFQRARVVRENTSDLSISCCRVDRQRTAFLRTLSSLGWLLSCIYSEFSFVLFFTILSASLVSGLAFELSLLQRHISRLTNCRRVCTIFYIFSFLNSFWSAIRRVPARTVFLLWRSDFYDNLGNV